jgi:hypothetical protein
MRRPFVELLTFLFVRVPRWYRTWRCTDDYVDMDIVSRILREQRKA